MHGNKSLSGKILRVCCTAALAYSKPSRNAVAGLRNDQKAQAAKRQNREQLREYKTYIQVERVLVFV